MAFRRSFRRFSRVRPRFRRTVRRPIGRRRFPMKRQVDKYMTSTGGSSAGHVNFKRKRFNARAFAVQRRKASDHEAHHRSNNALNFGSIGTAAVPQQQNVNFLSCISDYIGLTPGFWQTSNGLVLNDGDDLLSNFGGNDLFLRGGITTLTITNPSEAARSIKVRTWRARTTPNSSLANTTSFITSQDWDPSLVNAATPDSDPWKLYKFWDNVDVILKPGDTYERRDFLKARKIDQSVHNAFQNRDFWIVALQNMTSNSVIQPVIIISHNLSFTGDRVV